jgi:hypothetical protein
VSSGDAAINFYAVQQRAIRNARGAENDAITFCEITK